MIIIGKYDEFAPGMGYPSVKDDCGKHPHQSKGKILEYLRSGNIHMVTASRIVDVFTGETTSNELFFMNDGMYSWSSKVTYYVEKIQLEPPERF